MREDWINKELGKVCFTTSGGTPSRKIPEYYEGDIPWVKSGELNHNLIRDTEEHISGEAIKNSSAKIFPEGTLLIALYGATIGKLAILGIPATTNQAVCGIFKNDLFVTKFLFYYLFHKKQKLIEQGAGGAQPNISQTILKKLLVPIAPLPEQRAIVAKIEQLFSELDNGISNLKAAKDKLEIYRQAVLKKAFEGDWAKCKVGDKFDFLGGGTPRKSNLDYWNGKIPWCSVKDVKGDYLYNTKDYITQLGVKESATNIAEIDQVILITRISPGKSIISKVKTAINQDLKIVLPKVEYEPKYIHYLFKNLELECVKKSSGTTVLGINLNNLKAIVIPDMPLGKQDEIIEFIESRLSICDNILSNIEESMEKSEALRQSILKQAFEGKLLKEEELEECRKEPDWEPAEEMLERIEKQKF